MLNNQSVVYSIVEAYAKVAFSFSQKDKMAEMISIDAGPTACNVQKGATNLLLWNTVGKLGKIIN